jgi:dCMP deaminase
MRPSFEQIYMQLAINLSERATCKRLCVGAVIASSDFRQILAVGYNGNAAGLHNTCDSDEAGNCGCLHAEDNAVINCNAPRAQEKVVFVTHLPCKICAKRLVNLGGVIKVYYNKEYRIVDSLDVFEQCNIECHKLETTTAALGE